jgi:RNA polymerase sigma-70 factor, ECF subfamily
MGFSPGQQSRQVFESSIWREGMSEPVASTPVQATAPKATRTSGEEFVCAFNAVRTELVSSLAFLLGNHDDAQDAAQEAFLKCWRIRDDLPDVQNLKAWIFRIGINAAKDLQRNAWRRRARPLSSHPKGMDTTAFAPDKVAQENEDRERLRQAILDLRPEEKEVYLLRQNGSLTYEEIAEMRRSPVGTVKTQMRAAIAKLRRVLQEK